MNHFSANTVSIALLVGWLLNASLVGDAQARNLAVSASDTGAKAESKYGSKVDSFSHNRYGMGSVVRPPSSVDGDFMAIGGKVIVDQPVKGDASLLAGSVNVLAPIGDDLRAAGGEVTVSSTVGGEAMVTAGSIVLTKSAKISDAASLSGGEVHIDGIIQGPLRVHASKLVLNGEVSGDAHIFAETIELGNGAKIGGALTYGTASEIKKADGAVIVGSSTREPFSDRENRQRDSNWKFGTKRHGSGYADKVVMFLALFASAAVFLLIFPAFCSRTSERLRTSPLQALGFGFLALIGLPALAGFLFITILGIPLALLVLALYPALILIGYVMGIYFLSQRAQAAWQKQASASIAINILFFGLALIIVMLVSLLPFIGKLLVCLLTVFGMGAFILALCRCKPAETVPTPEMYLSAEQGG